MRERIKVYQSKQPAVDAHCEIAEKAAMLGEPFNVVTLPDNPGLELTEFNLPIAHQEVIVRPLTNRSDMQPLTFSLGHTVVMGMCAPERCNRCILDTHPNGRYLLDAIVAESQIYAHGRTIDYEIEP